MRKLNQAEINAVSGAGEVDIKPVPNGWFDRLFNELFLRSERIDVGDTIAPHI
ncbi:hypothetical protein [Pandoraea horticolens]|nr:hypothetical protein [Pandoraea horticolens]